MEEFLNTNAFILTGGQSRRFGGDKAMYQYGGKPLIAYPAEMLNCHFEKVTIVAKNDSTYVHLGYPVIEDSIPYQTPLAGIYTALNHTKTEWNFILACDMPMMTKEVIQQLFNAISESSSTLEIVVPQTEQGLQPLAAFYHKSLENIFIDTARKVNSIKDFIRKRNSKIIEFKSDKPFTNVNTKEQLRDIC